MLNVSKISACVLGFIALSGATLAQDAETAKFYKLDFVLKEVEGTRVLNTRAYSTMISADKAATAAIRTGVKVPFQTTPSGVQYADVGVNIDCRRVRETQRGLVLVVDGDVSSLPQEQTTTAPMIRQTKWSSEILVPVGKPVMLFSSDDPVSKRQMQLQLTAMPIP